MQINKHIRWRFKLEPTQCLSVHVKVLSIWDASESFLCKMTKDGRIIIPKFTMDCLKKERQNIDGFLVEVTLEPFE